jgi:hypothetical protein
MAVTYLFFVLATFCLSLRLVSRLVILRMCGLDEVAIVVSYVSNQIASTSLEPSSNKTDAISS